MATVCESSPRDTRDTIVRFDRPSFWYLPLPILAGPLKGRWWLPASGGKLTRILLASYEPEQTSLFRRLAQPGGVVLDVGAAAGYYTLLASRLVGRQGRVVAFEPDPRNAFYLKQHVRFNFARNVTVRQVAVANEAGPARFAGGSGTGTGHLDLQGKTSVWVVRLDDAVRELGLTPTHIKIDVEGAELDVLQGAQDLLARCRPILFLSTHNSQVHAQCLEYLGRLGYRLEPILGDDLQTTTEILAQAA